MIDLENKIEQIITCIKEIYYESSVNKLFPISSTSHEKIINTLGELMFQNYDIGNEANIFSNVSGPSAYYRLLSIVINLVCVCIVLSKYIFASIWYRFFGDVSEQMFFKSDAIKYVFINSRGKIDRYKEINSRVFEEATYKIYYCFSNDINNIKRKLRDQGDSYLYPHIYFFSVLNGFSRFLFRYGMFFTSNMLDMNIYPIKHKFKIKIVAKILTQLCSLVVHYHWAQATASKLFHFFKNAIFIFDIDAFGKEMMLAECFNKLGATTLLVQHGILTYAKQYIPSCSYMACCSERSRQSLIIEGVDKKKLYVYGQSLQTIKDSMRVEERDKIYNPLVLAGNGSMRVQNLYVCMLRKSKCLASSNQVFMRFHPAMSLRAKKLWIYNHNVRPINPALSLEECLSRSEIVVTFSLDALVASLRLYRPTIVCIPNELFVPSWYDFLYSIPIVQISTTSSELDYALYKFNSKKFHMPDSYYSIDKQLDFAFGPLNSLSNVKELLEHIWSIRQKKCSNF